MNLLLFMVVFLISTALLGNIEKDTFNNYQSIVTRNETLSYSQLSKLFEMTTQNEIAKLSELSKYDPSGQIGFCFGRAMAAHLLARRLKLPEENIRKLFVIGDLRSQNDPEWRFHVTTLVKGPNEKWFAIDPIMSEYLTMQDWISRVQSIWDKNQKAFYYITPASAILPDLSDVPDMTKETGRHIIEIKFKPNNKVGFTRDSDYSGNVYELTREAAFTFFQTTDEEDISRFGFLSIKINHELVEYRNYFVDLITNIMGIPDTEFIIISNYSIQLLRLKSREVSQPILNLYSPRFIK